MLGVIDLGDPRRSRRRRQVAERIRAALEHVPPERLVPAPDCGMKYLPREAAFGKLKALAEGAESCARSVSWPVFQSHCMSISIRHFRQSLPLVGSMLPDGFAQVTPRGSTMVLDDTHLALWERGKGTTNAALKDGSKLTIYFRNPKLRESGMLPKGGIARFYGTAKIHKSGPVYEEVWERLIQPEKDRDPDKKGFAVTISVERAEDLDGAPLNLK